MPNLNRHTVALTDNLKMLNIKLLKLIEVLRIVRRALNKTKRLLGVSRQLSDDIDKLYNALSSVDQLLKTLSNVPYIGPVIRILRRGVTPVKNTVKDAKYRINKLEEKIDGHRTKIRRFIAFTDKALYTLTSIQRFLKKEQTRLNATYEATGGLEDGRYKNLSQERINNTAKKLDSILVPPNEIVDAVPRSLHAMKLISEEVNRLCELIEQVFQPIDRMYREINRIAPIAQLLNMALDIGIGPLTIKRILRAPKIPGIDKLIDKATKVLDPLLKPLILGVRSIPGLEESIGNLNRVSKKLNDMDRLIRKVTDSISSLTGEHKPQSTFKRINAGYDFK